MKLQLMLASRLIYLFSIINAIIAFTSPLLPARYDLRLGRGNVFLSSQSSEGLAVLNNSAYSLLTDEAKYIRAIRACDSAAEVQDVLDRATDPISPNMAAAAMRTMIKFDRNSQVTSKALPMLMKVAGSSVVAYSKQDENQNMTITAIQDVLYSLSLLKKEATVPLATLICEIMTCDLSRVLDKLETRRLVEIMEAARSLSLKNHPKLFDAIAAQLSKADAVGKLAPSKICEALLPLSSYPDALVRFLRRLRKHAVRKELNSRHITMAIRAAAILRDEVPHLLDEIQVMAYTLVNRELSRPILGNTTTLVTQLSAHQATTVLHAISKFEWGEVPVTVDLYRLICQSSQLAPVDVTLTLQSMSNFKNNNPDTAVQLGSQLLRWLKDGHPIKLRQMNMILTSVFRQYNGNPTVWSVYEAALTQFLSSEPYKTQFQNDAREFDIATCVWFLSEAGIERDVDIGKALGNALLLMSSENLDPASFVMAIRYAVKMYARVNSNILRPYLEAAKQTCRGEFLERLESRDLSFLVEALVIAKCTHEGLFVRLAQAATRPHIVDECTPSSARRIMSSFATVATRIASPELHEYQRQIFELLGASLLTTQLMPYEAADAVFSYAKAGYISDMGVFDHVVDLVGQNLGSLSTQQVSKCLWACGKMYAWERSAEIQAPPYLATAKAYTKHLSSREAELSAKDLAQCLWAMGRLAINDETATKAFATRAKVILPSCFACEASNIVWGLSKVGFDDDDVMVSISRRMLDADIHASPEEAACVLYALGNAGIREDEVFEHLTEIMMTQVESVGAQAMANALWAHNVVGKLPPPALLQSWASDKLGLVGFLPLLPDYEWDSTG
ncbi:hypothetical protein MHU86_7666 [Fragilaria crotonensis]|nr:hypothetical protein MHU86_7666 [Fragilaria crotonensis]